MDPCPFVRVTIGKLGLKFPVASKPARSEIHPSSSPCFCKIKLKNFPVITSPVPCIEIDSQLNSKPASFHLNKLDLEKLAGKSKKVHLRIAVYTGGRGTNCGLSSARLLGRVSVQLDLEGTDSKGCVFHNGWIGIGNDRKCGAMFHMNLKAEPDPRFVFEFDGEPECSPQVFQIKGNVRQPVFTCKFSFRSTGGNQRTRSLQSEANVNRGWLSSFGSDRERQGKERKGWSITVHDLSGSPVAAASMVTPFVASPGSDRVSRSNPGSWLILRPGDGTWKPWGRLEAWRERGSSDGLGYRFELSPDNGAAGILLAESTLSSYKGGKFSIDLGRGVGTGGNTNGQTTPVNSTSPVNSPRGSGDHGYNLWPYCKYKGFVMSASIEGEGSKCSKPAVEVSVQHVNCTEDAAVFVALSAAIDLSMDACRLFSQKLRKELCQPEDQL